MAWFAELAGKAENLLNNLDAQTGAALKNHNVVKTNRKINRHDACIPQDSSLQRRCLSVSPKRRYQDTKEGCDNTKPPWKPPNHIPRPLNRNPVPSVGLPGSKSPSPSRRNSALYNLSDGSDVLHKTHRRNSLPTDLEDKNASAAYKTNLQVENAILKSELADLNIQVTELLERVQKTDEELNKSYGKADSLKALNEKVFIEKETLERFITELKMKVHEAAAVSKNRETELKQKLEEEINVLKESNNELENRIQSLEIRLAENAASHSKLEKELRHQQSTNQELQISLDKSTAECRRLEREWDGYKVRVKNMLSAKDCQIKSLQEGSNLTEDTKMLMEQIDNLRVERDDLELQLSQLRSKCDEMMSCMQQLEIKSSSSERMVAVLREAMREERASKNSVESECFILKKDIRALQQQTTETIANLRSAILERETEINQLRESTSQTIDSVQSSALNVADYTTKEDTDKMEYLTQALVQRQTRIDTLLAENNTLKIQLDKLESKYRNEVANLRMNNNHSIVNVDDNIRLRNKGVKYIPESVLESLSLRLGVFIRRYPIFRLFILFYMVGLHLWVLTVLFTSTPDIIPKRGT